MKRWLTLLLLVILSLAFVVAPVYLIQPFKPQTPRALRAIPLARGLVRLGASLSPLFRRTGVARRRERVFLAVAIFAPLALRRRRSGQSPSLPTGHASSTRSRSARRNKPTIP